MLTLNDGRTELWQWDTGRTLAVDADCSQVHFSNKVFGRSVDVDVVGGVANIPDILLQTEKDLIAWAFVGTAENGYTKISKVFKVNRRNKPADYVFTPSEQTTLAEIMERLDGLESIQDPDAIKNAVDDYLANNPIKVDETDPTVPEWAKQATPPDVKIPDKLPNPNALTFTGAVSGTYDGSSAVTIDIPVSGGNAEDGFSPIATVEQTATGAVVSITDKTGTTTATITNGKDGKDGADGQPGKDGEDGKDGTAGKSAYEYAQEAGFVGTEEEFAQKLASEGSGGNVDESTVTKIVDEYLEKNPPAAGNDGLTPHIGDNGNWFLGETDSGVKAQGKDGQRGRGILKINKEPAESGETVNEITAPYKVYRNVVMNDAGVAKDDILVGDLIMHASNLYKVLLVEGSYVYLDNPVSIQGEPGEDGKTAYAYAQEAGFTGTEEEFAKKLANDGDGGGVSSWNDLTDKPFGNVVVTFDGNLDGKTAVSLYDGVYLVKVSDKVLSEAECVGANVAVSVYGYENTATAVGTQDLTSEYGISCFMPVFGDSSGVPYVVIVRESGTVMEQEVSSGTYFIYMEDDGLVYTKSCDALNQVKTIAPQYLPDYLPGIETIDPVFNGDLTGREKILADVNTGAYAVKVTPQIVSVDELIGATMVLNMGGTEQSITLTAEMAMDSSFVLGVPGAVVLQGTDHIVLSLATNSIIQGASFSAGTWFMCIPGSFYVKSLSCLTASETIRKLDEKFLPDMTDSINALIDAKLGVIENGSY